MNIGKHDAMQRTCGCRPIGIVAPAGSGSLLLPARAAAHRVLLMAAALLIPTTSSAAPADEFHKVLAEHWRWWLTQHPVQATSLGMRAHDDKLGDPSLAGVDRAAQQAGAFLERLDRIAVAALSPADRTNHAVLRRELADHVAGARFGQRAITFTTYSGWHSSFAALPDAVPLFSKADYASYLARLAAYPAYNRAAIDTTRAGLEAGYAQPCEPLAGYEKTIAAHIVDQPEASVFWRPFVTRPAAIAADEWPKLQARARTLIMQSVVPAYRAFLTFYTKDYVPKCRRTIGISATPGGADYYAFRVREITTTDMTPEQIHQLGLQEVARIGAAMDKLVADSGFKGTRSQFVARMRNEPRHVARTPQELLDQAAATAKTIDGWMPKLFGRLPRLPYTVKPIPPEQAEGTTTAYYEPGQLAAGRAGVYRVNTSKLDQRPLYELPALTAHEAVPGHHHQIALQQELDLPEFRRHAASFTAFTEGWGLYAESLGEEMGLYDTPEKKMGQLSYEMWRACRLVVDTGIHIKGWTRLQAIDFMLDHTALSRGNIEAEVNRYITWPGQALAYKVGERTIRRLRAKAEAALGAKFDPRGFHDAVLANGAVPLSVLEAAIDAWIARSASGSADR